MNRLRTIPLWVWGSLPLSVGLSLDLRSIVPIFVVNGIVIFAKGVIQAIVSAVESERSIYS